MKTDLSQLRKDFPILSEKIHGHPLVYLDNAATTQMPSPVSEAMAEHLRTSNGNVHRGMHTLSLRSTSALEKARENARAFIGAGEVEEIIFTSGATASVNLLAAAFRNGVLSPGDSVVASEMEHHSNFVPWQQVCRYTGAQFRVAPITGSGELDIERLEAMLDPSVKLIALTWVSNVTGAVNPVKRIVRLAHEKGAAVFIDAAQAMRHFPVDVKELDCDFLAFSGHKLMGPTGTGVLYGKKAWLEKLPASTFGGGMVDAVTAECTTFDALPFKFEAGTPNYIGAIGLSAALDYLSAVGIDNISRREHSLTEKCENFLRAFPEIRVLGAPAQRVGAVSFVIGGMHPTDTAMLLDSLGIAVRSGHHCAQPLLRRFGLESAVRVSPAFYNSDEELDVLAHALEKIIMLRRKMG